MYKVIVLEKAEERIGQAYWWYEDRVLGLGDKFLSSLKNTLANLEKNPESYSLKYDVFRTVMVSGFPYQVHYFINAEDRHVLISTVRHSSRKPLK